MKLDIARLCLDCEEVHAEQRCPSCGSEAVAFIRRWVPLSEGSSRHRAAPETPPRAEIYRRLLSARSRGPTTGRLLAQGALGLAAVGLAGLIWRVSRRRRSDE